MNIQPSLTNAEVQVQIFAAGFDSHPPMIVGHLLQMDESSIRHDLIQGRPSIRQVRLASGSRANYRFSPIACCHHSGAEALFAAAKRIAPITALLLTGGHASLRMLEPLVTKVLP